MKNNRCPWCGKLINRVCDQRGVRKRETPHYFRFARCSHCGNYYGQYFKSARSLIPLLMAVALLIIGYAFDNGVIILFSVPVVLSSVFIPLQRMDENECPIKETLSIFKGNFESDEYSLKKDYYMLTDDYDSRECYSVVSPIKIMCFNKKTNEVEFVFLYEHPDNREYIGRGSFRLFDANGINVGIIKIINNM